jgi:hypothetical protein
MTGKRNAYRALMENPDISKEGVGGRLILKYVLKK